MNNKDNKKSQSENVYAIFWHASSKRNESIQIRKILKTFRISSKTLSIQNRERSHLPISLFLVSLPLINF